MHQKEPNTDTLANGLASQIRQDIEAKGFQEGAVFMTGDEVAVQYGVSRGIAREAISQLRALGVLKSRQGKGLIVGKSDPVVLFERSLPFYGSEPEDKDTLAQLRYVLEIGSVDLAIANATEEQIQTLRSLAQEFKNMVSAPECDEKKVDEIELAFHGLILKMTGNPLISGMHRVISDYFEKAAENISADSPSGTRSQKRVWEHEVIVESFEKRDQEMARTYLRKHLEWVFEKNGYAHSQKRRRRQAGREGQAQRLL